MLEAKNICGDCEHWRVAIKQNQQGQDCVIMAPGGLPLGDCYRAPPVCVGTFTPVPSPPAVVGGRPQLMMRLISESVRPRIDVWTPGCGEFRQSERPPCERRPTLVARQAAEEALKAGQGVGAMTADEVKETPPEPAKGSIIMD